MKNSLVMLLALLFSVSANAAIINLTEKNTVTLRGPVDGNSVKKVQRELHDLSVKRGFANYPIFLVLDTPGGSIDDGEDLIQFAKSIRNLHTITLFAASMGSAIVQALPGKRLITEHGVQMYHRAKVGLSGQIEDGELEVRLTLIKNMVRALEQRNASRMSMPLQTYKKRVKDEMWFSASQAMAERAADAIVDLKCSDSLVKREERLSVQVFIFNINLAFSGCPLFRVPEVVNDRNNKLLYNRFEKEVRQKLSGRKELLND